MKKYFILLAAVLGMVACNKNNGVNNEEPAAPGKKVTLHATVANPNDAANGPHRVKPTNPGQTIEAITYKWEEGDVVYLIDSEDGQHTFTIVNSTINDNQADFEGESFEGLSDGNYSVAYCGGLTISEVLGECINVTYQGETFKPIVTSEGTQSADGFTLTHFSSQMHLQLTGAVTLGKIEYYTEARTTPSTVMTFSEGLTLTSTATNVYLPILTLYSAGFTLKFYDNAATPALIMEKATTYNLVTQEGKIVNFPELEVKAVPSYAYVDLGLSVKWATMNVGATNGTTVESWYGQYFAWGETTAKSSYDWSTYSLCNGSSSTMTKYCTSSSYGTVDNKTVLESADDAATANWGGSWRMPTKAEQDELRTNCTWTWKTDYQGISGLNGCVVTSNKTGYTDKSIFLPAAGFRDNSSLNYAGSLGLYWSSSLNESDSYDAWVLYFYSSGVGTDNYDRYVGRSVRPVCQ